MGSSHLTPVAPLDQNTQPRIGRPNNNKKTFLGTTIVSQKHVSVQHREKIWTMSVLVEQAQTDSQVQNEVKFSLKLILNDPL